MRLLYHVRIEQKVEREQVAKVTGTNKDDSAVKKPAQRAEKKIYPNDPAPAEAARSTNSAAEGKRSADRSEKRMTAPRFPRCLHIKIKNKKVGETCGRT